MDRWKVRVPKHLKDVLRIFFPSCQSPIVALLECEDIVITGFTRTIRTH